jgi:hypothetical protein
MKTIFVAAALILGVFGVPNVAYSVPSLDFGQSDLTGSDVADDSTAVNLMTESTGTDDAIGQRLRGIYQELDGLQKTKVAVDSGVVTLSGSVTEPADIDRARQIALRVKGVVAVQNSLQRDRNVSQNLAPVLTRLQERLQ